MTFSESIFFWMAAVLLALAFLGSLLSLIFKKTGIFKITQELVFVAFGALTILGAIRWTGTAHPPFVTLFESMLTAIWFTLFIYVILTRWFKRFDILVIPVSLFSFLMMGWSSSLPMEGSPLSQTLTNTWLFIHASFATSGAASFLIAASFSAIYLLGQEKLVSLKKIAPKMPDYQSLPKTTFNFVIFGFILWGVMIVSGSIWAHAAWGRYWAWDPIEVWSLISWLLYALLVHTRMAFKISRKFFCSLTIFAALLVAFALWGVGYIYETIHSYG